MWRGSLRFVPVFSLASPLSHVLHHVENALSTSVVKQRQNQSFLPVTTCVQLENTPLCSPYRKGHRYQHKCHADWPPCHEANQTIDGFLSRITRAQTRARTHVTKSIATVTRIHPEVAPAEIVLPAQAPTLVPVPDPEPAQERSKHARKNGATRGDSDHRGIVLIPPNKKAGERWYVARIEDDPADVRRNYKYTLVDKNKAEAIVWAKGTSERIIFQRQEEKKNDERLIKLLLWTEDPEKPCALRQYIAKFSAETNGRKQKRSLTTARRYLRDCLDFVRYCNAHGTTYAHEIRLPVIAGWRDSRFIRLVKSRGDRRSNGSINLERQSIRLFLKRLIVDGYIPRLRLDSAMVYECLKLETKIEPKKRFLSPAEYRKTLHAYIEYDKKSGRTSATITLLCAKLGLRREEVSLIQVKEVHLSRDWKIVINLPASKAKYGKARTIRCEPFSPVAAKLLAELVRNRGPEEYISDLDYAGIGNITGLIRSYGAPKDFHHHMLRRTSICYCGPMLISETERSDQYGNEAEVSRKYYQAADGLLPLRAESIDEVVRLKEPQALKLEARILEAARLAADARTPQKKVAKRIAARVKIVETKKEKAERLKLEAAKALAKAALTALKA